MVVTVVVGPSTDNTIDSHNTPTNTEHQELQFIRFVTKGIMLITPILVTDHAHVHYVDNTHTRHP